MPAQGCTYFYGVRKLRVLLLRRTTNVAGTPAFDPMQTTQPHLERSRKLSPKRDGLRRHFRQSRPDDLWLWHFFHLQGRVPRPRDQRTQATNPLCADRVPDMGRYHADLGRRYAHFVGDQVIDLRRGFETANFVNAEGLLKSTSKSGILERR
jgi:hypothetical protein